MSARGEDLVAACAKLSDVEIQDLHEAERVARQFLACDLPFSDFEDVSGTRGFLHDILAGSDM